jgi:hypothetical protein
MKKLQATILILVFLIFGIQAELPAADCPFCHTENISALSMNCPECGGTLHDPALNYHAKEKATLEVNLYYTGENPERLPPYGKLFINGKYVGNIAMIEKEVISKDFSQVWADGLGKTYSAYYQKRLKNIPEGILKIEVEMKFDRFYGLARSYKRVVFPYVSFEAGENTTVKHYFNSATSFHRYKPAVKKPLPLISDMKIQGASGTVALNVPLFE